jgi:hypothetical protein
MSIWPRKLLHHFAKCGTLSSVLIKKSAKMASLGFSTRWLSTLLCGAIATPASGAEPINEDYVRSLAAPGKTVLVIEYFDGQGGVVKRKGFASAAGFQPVSPTDFRVAEGLTLHLYGVEPCEGEMVNRKEDFSGPCAEFATRGLSTMLKAAKVIYCRAFVSEENRPVQDATCYSHFHFPGSLDAIDMFEEQLVSLGNLRLTRKPDGLPLRPDLTAAEKIAKSGYGMWADPRISTK